MYKTSMIITNAVDLAKQITKLNENGKEYKLNIVKGIDGEDVVKLEWNYMEED